MFIYILEFYISDLIPREVGEKIDQVFNDELLILKDCLIRLWNYKYIAVHDTDEFMIPYNVGVNGSWINFFVCMTN